MITIIHGDDVVASRKYLQEQKQKAGNPHLFDWDVELSSIIQITQGRELFSTDKKIFIENFFSKNKSKSSETQNIIDYINKNEPLFEVLFWEGKELQKKSLNLFDKPTIKTFMISKTIFLFLDGASPGSYKNTIGLFHKALQNTEIELIFYMLQRQFRLLLVLRSQIPLRGTLESVQIDEVTRLAPWQRGKLEKQAKLFSIDNLLDLYRRLYEIELNQKTGNLPYSLTHAIDFFLFSI